MIRFWKSTNGNKRLLFGFAALLLVIAFAGEGVQAAPKADAENGIAVSPVGFPPAQKAVMRKVGETPNLANPLLAPANPGDTCSADMGDIPWWLISGWIIGNEMYSNYQDPDLICPGAYPFTIQSAHMFMNIVPDVSVPLPLSLPMSVIVHDVDTTGGCTKPGAPLFIGSPGTVEIPAAGFYDIEIPMDAPFEVNGPYYITISFNDTIPFNWGLQLTTDSAQRECISYNFWDTAVGWLDMGNDNAVRQQAYPPEHCCYNGPPDAPSCDGCFDFDGTTTLFSFGILGGFPPEPAPGIAFLGPKSGATLFGSTDIWIAETAGSTIVDSAVFSYRNGGSWVRIGVDNDLTLAASTPPGPGDGISYSWDFSALSEGAYWLAVTLYDSLGRVVMDSLPVTLEPTPPLGNLSTPDYFERFCNPLTLSYTHSDDDLQSSVLFKKTASASYSKALETLSQFSLGDVDGDPSDGNPAAEGEYGDFYGGPAAAVLALRYWHGQGYQNALRRGGQTLTNEEGAEQLSTYMLVRANRGLTDERFLLGLRDYLAIFGFGELQTDFIRSPSYAEVRNWSEEVGTLPLLAVDGVPSRWLALDGFLGLPVSPGVFRVVVSDPSDGSKKTTLWRNSGLGGQLFYNNEWRNVDNAIAIWPSSWTVTGRAGIGFNPLVSSPIEFLVDGNGAAALSDGGLYFITAQLSDGSGNTGSTTILLEYNCATFVAGDYDGNGSANIGDLIYLISYQNLGGPAPVGGAARADADCGGTVDTGDMVYYINWLFGGGPAPCS